MAAAIGFMSVPLAVRIAYFCSWQAVPMPERVRAQLEEFMVPAADVVCHQRVVPYGVRLTIAGRCHEARTWDEALRAMLPEGRT